MKIGKPEHPKITPPANGTSATDTGSASVPATAIPTEADPSAKIALSSTASTLLSSNSTPEFDAVKVKAIADQIDKGTYQINHGAIADKLISNAQELLTRAQTS
jgi:negative regulator of flagellin synthesis FlgM